MKKLLLILSIFSCSFTLKAQENFYIMLNSNIEYAPVGGGIIIYEENFKTNFFINVKISEDYFTRELSTKEEQKYVDSRIFDINELIITAGALTQINDNLDFIIGGGFLSGQPYQPQYNNNEVWFPVDKSTAISPVFTTGFAYNINRFKLLLGYEVAFVKPEDYPIQVLNTNSFGRLSSATFGIAYNLIGKNQ